MRSVQSIFPLASIVRPMSRPVSLFLAACALLPTLAEAASYSPQALACYQGAARGDSAFPTACKAAADLGDTHAMFLLGLSSKDPDKGVQWLERAAEGNHLRALAELAARHERQGDVERADALYRRAAQGGHGPSRIRIARMLRADTDNPANVALARRTLVAEAAAGYPEAQHLAAVMLAAGEGGPVDEAAARRWLLEAASAGYLPAQYDHAMSLVDGDRAEARNWLRKAARAGHVQSNYALAVLGAHEPVAPGEHRSALYWAHLAVRAGHPQANELLDEIVSGKLPHASLPRIESLADVQSALASLGYDPGPADGVMGSRTRTAIEQFQRASGLAPNGEVDSALRERLARSLAEVRRHAAAE